MQNRIIPLLCFFGILPQAAMAELSFGDAHALTQVNSPWHGDLGPAISPNGLELFFLCRQRPEGAGGHDICLSERESISEPFGVATHLGPDINTEANESHPDITGDGLLLVFGSTRSEGFGQQDIWQTTRKSLADPWDSPVNVGRMVNSSGWEGRPTISSDGLTLIFDPVQDRFSNELMVSTRQSRDAPFGPQISLGIAGSAADLSADGLSLFFERLGEFGQADIYIATRGSTTEPFGEPVNLGSAVNGALSEFDPAISFDGTSLYFARADLNDPDILSSIDLWEIPIVATMLGDFNENGILDAGDINILFANNHDLNDDGVVDRGDRDFWVHDLAGTWYGDANLDGEFNSGDLVFAFQSGKYETDEPATWENGDWNLDGVFTSHDLVEAFQDDGYEQGPRPGVNAVPEPASWLILIAGLVGWGALHREQRDR